MGESVRYGILSLMVSTSAGLEDKVKEGEGMKEKAEAVRSFDEDVLLAQIGRDNVWAISGGRVGVWKPNGECMEVELPISSGYLVRIILAGDDTYTVERILRRRPKGQTSKVDKVLGRMEGVYCDQVGEVAYYASCYKSHPNFEALDANKYAEAGE